MGRQALAAAAAEAYRRAMRRIAVTFATALLAALPLALPAAPAQAATGIGFAAHQRLTTTSATIRLTCPNDPPATLFVSVVETDRTGAATGIVPITCTGERQRVRVPFTESTLHAGGRADLTVTMSGDSGEMNGFFTDLRIRRGCRHHASH
jgi:hypothetical protein